MYEDHSETINTATKLVKSCLLPELTDEDIGTKNFDLCISEIEMSLEVLFDFIRFNEINLFTTNDDTIEFQLNLVILLCEQTIKSEHIETPIIFHIKKLNLIKNLNNLIEKYFLKITTKPNVYLLIINYYKNKIKRDVWHKNLSSVYGLVRFCELYYDELNKEDHQPRIIDTDNCMFLLSAGLLFVDNYDPTNKDYGFKLFNILLSNCISSAINVSNIHKVIYKNCLLNIKKVKTNHILKNIFDCLCKCLNYDKKDLTTMFSKWNDVDDVFELILSTLKFETDENLIKLYYNFIIRLSYIEHNNVIINNLLIEFSTNEISIENLNTLKTFYDNSENNLSKIYYRWVKLLLENYEYELTKNMFEKQNYLYKIYLLYACYLVTLYTIPIELIFDKLKSFVITLVSTIKTFISLDLIATDHLLKNLINSFLTTLNEQLHKSVNPKYDELKDLLKTTIIN